MSEVLSLDDRVPRDRCLGLWGLGLSGSLVGNLALVALIALSLRPDRLSEQDRPEAEFTVSSESIPRSQAQTVSAEGSDIAATSGSAQSVEAGAIPQSTARPAPANGIPLALTPPDRQPAAPSVAPAQSLNAALPAKTALPSLGVKAQGLRATPPLLESPLAPPPEAQKLASTPVAATSALLPEVKDVAGVPLSPTSGPVADTPAQSPEPDALNESAPSPDPLPTAAAPSEAIRASFAFPGQNAADIDPTSLTAYNQFLDPGAEGEALRDGLGGVLASLPCARVQLSFDPETATLDLRGHVPEDSVRAPFLAALAAEMGADITLADNLRLLPRPQCGALAGIADVGLPQSTDQLTNPLLIGADAHARTLAYAGGEQLFFDLVAPDYPAFVYVDYFDAGGDVLHLMPNDLVPLAQAMPKAGLRVGAKEETDPGLRILVAPPYGQEIAVAFAASHPLFPPDTSRPLQEPAGPYLAQLKQAVATARSTHADFKGEWVYFLVVTSAP